MRLVILIPMQLPITQNIVFRRRLVIKMRQSVLMVTYVGVTCTDKPSAKSLPGYHHLGAMYELRSPKTYCTILYRP